MSTSLSNTREAIKWLLLKSRIVELLHRGVPVLTRLLPSLIRKARELGDHEAAIRIARSVLTTQPRSRQALKFIDQSMIESGQCAQLLAFYEHQNKIRPLSTTRCAHVLKLAHSAGEYQQVTTWSKRALDIDPGGSEAVQALGQQYCQAGEIDKLRGLLKRFEPEASIKPFLAFRIAFLMLRVGSYQKAIDLLHTARENHPGDFRLVASLLACEVARGNLEGAVKVGLEMLTLEDETRRARLFYAALVTAIEESACAKASYEKELAIFKRRIQHITSQPPLPAYAEWLQRNRDQMARIRSTKRSVRLMRDQSIRVSYICPIHRLDDVQNAINHISGQSWRNAEAVFAINGEITSGEDIAQWWDSDINLKIVECNDLDRIGAILNRAIRHSEGDIIIRIDADNIYMPDYATDAVLSLEHFNADLIGHNSGCRLLKNDGLIMASTDRSGFRKAKFGEQMGGASLCFRRELFEQLTFSDELRRGEDSYFVMQSIARNFRVFLAGPLNFLSVRSDDSSAHTWDVSKSEILLLGTKHVLGTKADFEQEIAFPVAGRSAVAPRAHQG